MSEEEPLTSLLAGLRTCATPGVSSAASAFQERGGSLRSLAPPSSCALLREGGGGGATSTSVQGPAPGGRVFDTYQGRCDLRPTMNKGDCCREGARGLTTSQVQTRCFLNRTEVKDVEAGEMRLLKHVRYGSGGARARTRVRFYASFKVHRASSSCLLPSLTQRCC